MFRRTALVRATAALRILPNQTAFVGQKSALNTSMTLKSNVSNLTVPSRSFAYVVTRTREDVIQAALDNVATMGWTEEAVTKALKESGSNEKLNISDVAANFIFKANQETLAELRADEEFQKMSTRDQLVHAMLTRIRKNAPFASHGIGLLKLAMSPTSPIRAISAQLFLHEIWQVVKDQSPNQIFTERKTLLVSAYATAELAFANDQTPDLSLTRKTIESQIDSIPSFNMDILKNMSGMGGGSGQPGPSSEAAAKMLNTMLAAMEKAKSGNPMDAMKEMFSGEGAPSKKDIDAMMDMVAKSQGIDNSGPFGKAKMLQELLKRVGK